MDPGKNIIKLIALFISQLCCITYSFAQRDIVFTELEGNFLSPYIRYEKLENVRQIKQFEHHKDMTEPDITVEFSDNHRLERYVIDYRDSSYNVVFTFHQEDNNFLNVSQRSIHRYEILAGDGICKRVSDTSYSNLCKYFWKNDTVIKTSEVCSSMVHDFDTTLWIYDRNRLIRSIRTGSSFNEYFGRLSWQKTRDVTELYYKNNDQVDKFVFSRSEKFVRLDDSSFSGVTKEKMLIGPDTTYISYDNDGLETCENTMCRDGYEKIILVKKSKNLNRVKIYQYWVTGENRPRKLQFLHVVDYNEKGLPIASKGYSVSRFLGFGIRKIYHNKTYEYSYIK